MSFWVFTFWIKWAAVYNAATLKFVHLFSVILSLHAHPSPHLFEKNDFTLTSRQRNERMNHTFLFGAVISHSLLEWRGRTESSHLCCQNLKCSESLQIVSHPLVYLLGEKSPHISRRLLTRTWCSSSEHKWSCDTFIRQELRESPVHSLTLHWHSELQHVLTYYATIYIFFYWERK